jgi:hypothetical protein
MKLAGLCFCLLFIIIPIIIISTSTETDEEIAAKLKEIAITDIYMDQVRFQAMLQEPPDYGKFS